MIVTDQYLSRAEDVIKLGLRNDPTALAQFEEYSIAFEEVRHIAERSKEHFLGMILELVNSVNDIASRATIAVAPVPRIALPGHMQRKAAPVLHVFDGGK
jgi:hypothetical protein